MKKFLILFSVLALIAIPTFALTQKEETYAYSLLHKAEQSNNIDDFNAAVDYYVNLSHKYKELINTGALDGAVARNVDRYNTVQQKKYKTKARRYAELAIENGTQNLNTIVTGITLAAEDLDIEDMIKFYDYMCKINPQAGAAIKDLFSNHLTQVKQAKAYNTSAKWGTFNQLLNTYLMTRPRYSNTTCTTGVGGFVNCDTMGY